MQQLLKNFLIGVVVCNHVYPQAIGIVGGYNGTTHISYAALIDPSYGVQLLQDLPRGTQASILSVSMNTSGNSIIGGHQGSSGGGGGSYFALVNPLGAVQVMPELLFVTLESVQINSSGNSILAGGTGTYFGARTDSAGNIQELIGLPGGGGTLVTAAINDSGLAVVGGAFASYAALIQPNTLTVNTIPGVPNIRGSAVNSSGISIIGGDGDYVNRFDPSGNSLGVIHPPGVSTIQSVAINDGSTSIIGGTTAGGGAYASFIDSSGVLHSLSGDPLPAMGSILSVDTSNDFGCGNTIIGGYYTAGGAYAAYVDPTGVVHNIAGLPTGANASINSVSINELGIALLGGTSDGTNAYAALVTPWGGLTPLAVNSPQVIYSVSIRNFIPANQLTGNNLSFAQYIGQYAPEKAVYFCPSLFAKTLQEALESAAPTRNALSLFSAMNNLFFLNHSLSNHLRNHRHFRNETAFADTAYAKNLTQEETLVAGWFRKKEESPTDATTQEEPVESSIATCFEACPRRQRDYTLWFEAIGALVFQEEQSQTVGFDPSVGGFILGFERFTGWNGQIGGGAAYTFTHVHEKNNAGYSRIHQEYFFLYGTWSDEQWYVDGAAWAGIFQTHQVRSIHMTGFDFTSSSDPAGFQLSPHLEVGYDKNKLIGSVWQTQLKVNPFVMVDWANTWQDKYQERGSGPFNAGQKAHYASFLRAEAGLRFYERISFARWLLTLEEKGSYVHRHPFHVGTVNAFLVGSPGSFTVATLSSPGNLAAAEMSFIFEPVNHAYPYGSISYQGEFGRKYQSHQINAEISWDF